MYQQCFEEYLKTAALFSRATIFLSFGIFSRFLSKELCHLLRLLSYSPSFSQDRINFSAVAVRGWSLDPCGNVQVVILYCVHHPVGSRVISLLERRVWSRRSVVGRGNLEPLGSILHVNHALLYTFVINTVAVTVHVLISLLFPVNCSYINL